MEREIEACMPLSWFSRTALADDWRTLVQGSRFRGRSGWLQKLYSLLGRGKQEETSAIVAVVNATKPVGLRSTKRASAMRRQQSAFIVHEEPAL
jgi:hypothetical protein